MVHQHLHDEAAPVGALGHDQVRERDVAEEPAHPLDHDRQVAVGLELGQPEDQHDWLTDLEVLHAGNELLRAAAAPVVDPVV